MKCLIGDAWLPSGNMIQSSPTQETGVALELGIRIIDGFSNPLLSLDEPISSRNPIAQITFDFETKCFDESCTLYFIEVFNFIDLLKFSSIQFEDVIYFREYCSTKKQQQKNKQILIQYKKDCMHSYINSYPFFREIMTEKQKS